MSSRIFRMMEKPAAGTPPERIPQIKDAGVLAILKRQRTTNFPPGTKWDYSNSGYAVLAMVVQKVSGKPFGDFLHDRNRGLRKRKEFRLAPRVRSYARERFQATDGLAGTGPEFNFGRIGRWWR